ncbi:hypothetical protein HY251_02765 [bacterium]|nr:hypothetical protein [bacterium]
MRVTEVWLFVAVVLATSGCGESGKHTGAPPASVSPAATAETSEPAVEDRTSTPDAPAATPPPVTPPSTTDPGTEPPPPPPPPAKDALAVAVWLPYWASTSSMDTVKAEVGKSINEVDVFAYSLNTDGSLGVKAHAHDAALISAIHANRSLAFMTCTGDGASTVVPSATLRAAFVKAVVKECDTWDLDGADLDFETLASTNRKDFTTLCKDLASALHDKSKLLSITVIAKTADHVSWGAADALDYAKLGKIADSFKLMTYDYSGPWGGPGPIGPIYWSEKVLAFCDTAGVDKTKTYLGVPFYGRDWPASHKPGAKDVPALTTTAAEALALSATKAVTLDEKAGEATFEYVKAGETHTVWFTNDDALKAKAAFAKKKGLAGICCWSIGQDGVDFWKTLAEAKK